MSDRWRRGCVMAITAEVMWIMVLVLDVFVFTRITQWVWEHTVSVWLQVQHLTFVDAFIITLLSSVISFLLAEKVRKDIE